PPLTSILFPYTTLFRSRSSGFLALAFVLSAGALAFTPACVGGKQQISAEDKDRLKANILEAVPPDAKKVDINFENKVHVVGYKVDRKSTRLNSSHQIIS